MIIFSGKRKWKTLQKCKANRNANSNLSHKMKYAKPYLYPKVCACARPLKIYVKFLLLNMKSYEKFMVYS